MNYKRSYILNQYLSSRDIDKKNNDMVKYHNLFKYIDGMKIFTIKRNGDSEYMNNHFFYGNDTGKVFIHCDINSKTIAFSDKFISNITKILKPKESTNKITKNICNDIIKVHFKKEYGDIRHRLGFLEDNVYDMFTFKQIDHLEYTNRKRICMIEEEKQIQIMITKHELHQTT